MNSYGKKIYKVSVGIAAIIAYAVWYIAYVADISTGIKAVDVFLTIAAHILLPITAFTMIQNRFVKLTTKLRCINKWFLRTEFIDGVWVGYFTQKRESKPPLKRLVIEEITQNAETFLITGRAFAIEENHEKKADWTSHGQPIQIINGKFKFVYTDTHYDEHGAIFEESKKGFCSYDLSANGSGNYPNEMKGYFINFDEFEHANIHTEKLDKSHNAFLNNLPHLLRQAMNVYDRHSTSQIE